MAPTYDAKKDLYGFKLVDITYKSAAGITTNGVLSKFRTNIHQVPPSDLMKVEFAKMQAVNADGEKETIVTTFSFVRNTDDLMKRYQFLTLVGATQFSIASIRWGVVNPNSLLTTAKKHVDGDDANEVTKLYGGRVNEGWGNIAAISRQEKDGETIVNLGQDDNTLRKELITSYKTAAGKTYYVFVHLFTPTQNEEKTLGLSKLQADIIKGRRQDSSNRSFADQINSDANNYGIVIGGVVGGVVALALLIFVIYMIKNRQR